MNSSRQLELVYIDSMISITKNIKNNKDYPARSYIKKGNYFYLNKEYNKALKYYLIAQSHSESNPRLLFAIRHNLALLKKAVGSTEEALDVFQKNLKYLQKQDTTELYKEGYINTLYGIADSYHRMHLPDSASSYVHRGLEKAYRHEDKYMYLNFLLMSGINSNLSLKYNEALDSLTKMESLFDNSRIYNNNLSVCYFQIADAYEKLNEKDRAFKYLLKIDSLIDISNYSPEERDAFDRLIKYHQELDNRESQLKTMSKLISMDSFFYENNKNLKSDIVEKYDTALLIKNRDKIIKSLQSERNKFFNSFSISLFILLLK